MSLAVLIVGSSDPSAVAEALAERGFEPLASPSATADVLGAQPYRAIVLASEADRPPAQLIVEMLKSGRAGGSPIIVSLGVRDPLQRDQCLIAGAHDVSLDGQPEDIAGRVDAAVNGWLRAAPRRQLKATFRAQRGRQFIDLKVTDIDPTGFAIAPLEGLAEGALLRVSVALPDGELLAWGRLNTADGVQGVRLIGLVSEERLRIVSAIRGRPADQSTLRGASASAPSMPGPTPAPTPEYEQVTAPVEPDPAEEVTPPAGVDETVAAGDPVAADASIAADDSTAAPDPTAVDDSIAADAAIAADVAVDASIADAIGSALGDPPSVAAPAPVEQEGDTGVETILWPGTMPQVEACAEMLREAATMMLVTDRENAPPTHVVLAFARTLSPIEKRAFETPTPPELPEQGLAIKCLVHRLRMFALIDEATSVPTDGSATVLIDEEALARLTAEVKAASGELQKTIDGFVATAQTQRIKEVNTFRNALTRGQSDLKSAVARLRGEVMARSNMALLDVHEQVPGNQAPAPVVRRAEAPPPPEKKPELKPDFFSAPEATPQQRERSRIIRWVVAMVLLSGVWVALRIIRPPSRNLSVEELAELVDVKEVILAPRKHHAYIIVKENWKPDAIHRASLEAFAAKHQLEAFMVQNLKGEAVAAKVRNQKGLSVYAGAGSTK